MRCVTSFTALATLVARATLGVTLATRVVVLATVVAVATPTDALADGVALATVGAARVVVCRVIPQQVAAGPVVFSESRFLSILHGAPLVWNSAMGDWCGTRPERVSW